MVKRILTDLLMGRRIEGENIISKTPTVKTVHPDKTVSFNAWAKKNRVSASYVKPFKTNIIC